MSEITPAVIETALPGAVNSRSALAYEVYQGSTGEMADLDAYAKAANTLTGYASDWEQVRQWASQRGLADLPPVVDGRVELTEPMLPAEVKLYIADRQADLKSITVARHLTSLKHWHYENGLPSPTDHPEVKKTLAGMKRKYAYRPDRATPLYLEEVAQIVAGFDDSPKGVRDRAIMLLGFWTACRRSELVALTDKDLTDDPKGLIVHVARSKVDQTGAGRDIGVHYRNDQSVCAVRAVRAWVDLTTISGPVFRYVDRWGNVGSKVLSGQAVSLTVKAGVQSIGLDPDDYSAHSLRAGLVSWCDREGVPSAAIRAVTGHQSEAMMDSYSRPADLFAHSAGAYVDV